MFVYSLYYFLLSLIHVFWIIVNLDLLFHDVFNLSPRTWMSCRQIRAAALPVARVRPPLPHPLAPLPADLVTSPHPLTISRRCPLATTSLSSPSLTATNRPSKSLTTAMETRRFPRQPTPPHHPDTDLCQVETPPAIADARGAARRRRPARRDEWRSCPPLFVGSPAQPAFTFHSS